VKIDVQEKLEELDAVGKKVLIVVGRQFSTADFYLILRFKIDMF